ncbi:hypothetical protein ACJRO7_031593 [Eucalyptus globulus]|uniref:Uncharacterized protein n=1 Tax=Eucalyptus globulus TaxID=34317 RepID=A0ABD3JK07_EUCGL
MSSQKSNPLPRSQGYTVGTGLPVNYLQKHHHHHHHHLPQQQKNSVTWSSDIFHCCDDPCSCCTTLFCPCVTFGRIAVFADEGSSSCVSKGALYCLATTLTGCFLGGACCCGCCNCRRLKTQFIWQQNACNDCYVHYFCHCCALCQEYHHLQRKDKEETQPNFESSKPDYGSLKPSPQPH